VITGILPPRRPAKDPSPPGQISRGLDVVQVRSPFVLIGAQTRSRWMLQERLTLASCASA